MNKRNGAVFLVTLLLGLASSFFLFKGGEIFKKDDQYFVKRLQMCNREPINHRFSCYRSVLEKWYGASSRPIPDFLSNLEERRDIAFGRENPREGPVSYAVFGTNCHTFYHAVGDFIASNIASQPLDQKIALCSPACTGGCYMGLYKRTAYTDTFATSTLEKLYPFCPSGSKHQCAHEIGHLLHDKHVSPVLRVLDTISKRQYGLSPATTPQTVKTSVPDLAAPFAECADLVPKEELAYCYTGVGHNLFLFAQFENGDYRKQFDGCDKIPQDTRDDCYNFLTYRIGINDAAVKFLANDFSGGKDVCGKTVALSREEDVRSHCYKGIGAGIGLFLESELAHQAITEENHVAMGQMVTKYILLCDNIEKTMAIECYKGILGTRVKKFYAELKLKNEIIERLLPLMEDGFEAVG